MNPSTNTVSTKRLAFVDGGISGIWDQVQTYAARLILISFSKRKEKRKERNLEALALLSIPFLPHLTSHTFPLSSDRYDPIEDILYGFAAMNDDPFDYFLVGINGSSGKVVTRFLTKSQSHSPVCLVVL